METRYKTCSFFFRLAASLSILLCVSVFFVSCCVGTVMADPTSGDEPFLIVRDSDGKCWTEITDLNVFSNAQFNGDSVVAPGSEGSYDFTVQNISDFPLKYQISFGEENKDNIPLEFRLKENDGYLTEDWTSAAGLTGIEEALIANSKTGYTLEWRWIFNGDDVHDTALGRKAVETEVPYVLKVSYAAEQTGDAVNVSQPDNMETPKTVDDSNLALWIALILCSCTVLLLCVVIKRHGGSDNEES